MIELLAVAFILGIGLLGLAALMTWNLRAAGGGRQRDTAAYLANDAMERLTTDGRMSAALRTDGLAIATTYLLANATNGVSNDFQEADTGGTLQSTFDMEGRPSATNPVFRVQWVRRTPKGATPAASSLTAVSEVVVNVTWSEAQAQGAPTQKWLSCSRLIRY